MKTVDLVTGGAGFIGAHVVRELIQSGREVIVIDDLSGGFIENLHPAAILHQGSINDVAFVDGLFEKYSIDYVYHLAAYAAEGLSHFIRRFNYENNVLGSINLINSSIKHKVKCFVFTSSIAVYGSGECPLKESANPKPEDPYGIAKYTVELDLRAAHEMFGLNSIVFRPHNVYGEYQNLGDHYRNVIGIFMNQLMQGKALTIFGDGSQTRAFSYVGDVAPHIARSVQVPEAYNQVFNIGADLHFSVKELAETVSEVMGMPGTVQHYPARNEVLHAYSDHQKVKAVFGISDGDFTTLRQGLLKMAEWAKQSGIRKGSVFSGIEIREKLPASWEALSLS